MTCSEERARQAAEALLIGGQATDVMLEKAFLSLGAGSMTFGYQRTGHTWHALLTNGRVSWTRSTPLQAVL